MVALRMDELVNLVSALSMAELKLFIITFQHISLTGTVHNNSNLSKKF